VRGTWALVGPEHRCDAVALGGKKHHQVPGKDGATIFPPLAVSHKDYARIEIDVLDGEPAGL
jgi:hypothetical protein